MADEPYPIPGLPYEIKSHYSDEFKCLWKLVRRDDMNDIPGDIITADEATGECCLRRPDGNGGTTTTGTLTFGPYGLRIVPRRR
jgi:hypothetical protein